MFILKIILVLVLWFLIIREAHWFTNNFKIPEYLDWKPLSCFKCHSTWLGIGVYTTLMLQTHWYIPCTIGIILSILTGIAIHVDEKNKTINNYDDVNSRGY